MSDDFNIAKEPGFWVATPLALSPIIIGGIVIWRVQQ
jgi:hypothetical protein